MGYVFGIFHINWTVLEDKYGTCLYNAGGWHHKSIILIAINCIKSSLIEYLMPFLTVVLIYIL